MPLLSTFGSASARGKGFGGDVPEGQAEFTTPGTYAWSVPNGVSKISAVTVGAGGGGSGGLTDLDGGGCGGGLSWQQEIILNPGEQLTIVVGAGGLGGNDPTSGSESAIKRGSTYLLHAGGGHHGTNYTQTRGPRNQSLGGGDGGTVLGYDGGGKGGGTHANTTNEQGLGGGGAGGYSGNGGSTSFGTITDGTGGGGGAGDNHGTTAYGGGGVGIYGEGASGSAASPGGGGSGGTRTGLTTNADGGLFGGGGGGADAGSNAGNGGGGAVRIIWGPGRAYPSTNTADV